MKQKKGKITFPYCIVATDRNRTSLGRLMRPMKYLTSPLLYLALKKAEIIPVIENLWKDYCFPSYPLPFEKYSSVSVIWVNHSLRHQLLSHYLTLFENAFPTSPCGIRGFW